MKVNIQIESSFPARQTEENWGEQQVRVYVNPDPPDYVFSKVEREVLIRCTTEANGAVAKG
jgi:hypothetical protein